MHEALKIVAKPSPAGKSVVTAATHNRLPPDPKDPAARARKQRSRITNGSALLGPEADERSAWARRCRDVIAAHLADLGGEANTSTAERSLIRRIAILSVECERLETKFAQIDDGASPSDKSLDLYARMSGHLRRLLQTLGLGRRARDVGPSLGDLIKLDQERQRQQLAHEREQRREQEVVS